VVVVARASARHAGQVCAHVGGNVQVTLVRRQPNHISCILSNWCHRRAAMSRITLAFDSLEATTADRDAGPPIPSMPRQHADGQHQQRQSVLPYDQLVCRGHRFRAARN